MSSNAAPRFEVLAPPPKCFLKVTLQHGDKVEYFVAPPLQNASETEEPECVLAFDRFCEGMALVLQSVLERERGRMQRGPVQVPSSALINLNKDLDLQFAEGMLSFIGPSNSDEIWAYRSILSFELKYKKIEGDEALHDRLLNNSHLWMSATNKKLQIYAPTSEYKISWRPSSGGVEGFSNRAKAAALIATAAAAGTAAYLGHRRLRRRR
jgi:hypothetical protein